MVAIEYKRFKGHLLREPGLLPLNLRLENLWLLGIKVHIRIHLQHIQLITLLVETDEADDNRVLLDQRLLLKRLFIFGVLTNVFHLYLRFAELDLAAVFATERLLVVALMARRILAIFL
jgi:hypothetical protein